MFKPHGNIVWGTKCSCGKHVEILQNVFHPWDETKFTVTMPCQSCQNRLVIDQKKASTYYNEKIYRYFKDCSGKVIDLGCGGGFLTYYLSNRDEVTKIFSIDLDPNCRDYINQIHSEKVTFIHGDAALLSELFSEQKIDYVVSRDVFMFIENTTKFFDNLEQLVTKGVIQMGWYNPNSNRIKNNLHPDIIAKEFISRGFKVTLEYLDWYKYGYFIKAVKD